MVPAPRKPDRITLRYVQAEKRFRLGFEFAAARKQPGAAFDIDAAGFWGLIRAFELLQHRHNIPRPPSLRPPGRQKLSVVEDDEA